MIATRCYGFRILFVFFWCLVVDGSSATSLTEKIYYNINSSGFSMCFRRFNATHQIGCSSNREGNVGVVHLVLNDSDIDWLESNGVHPPYVVVMSNHMFKRDVFERLIDCEKVNGLVIIGNETDRPGNFSPDSTSPNARYGLYCDNKQQSGCIDQEWNPFGNGMMFEDVPFPMVALSNESDINFIIKECYEKYNSIDVMSMPKGYSLCAMEIKDIMDGAKDTPTCHRRTNLVNNLNPQGYCDPLSNLNVYSYVDALNKSHILENGSVIIIAARLDAFSLFDDKYPGYDSAVLGFVTLHAVAEALGKVRSKLLVAICDRPVMFALFNGEAFDYIGSSRMVYDIERQQFYPVKLESIGVFIEIGQIGLYEETNSLWIHTDPVSLNKSSDVQTKFHKLTNLLINFGSHVGLNITRVPEGNLLPPASLQQFLKSKKASIAGILLSNHKHDFVNRFYNSMYDTSDSGAYNHVTPIADHLQKISTSIARTVYSMLLNDSTDVEVVNSSNLTIANLIYCFTKNSDCEIFNSTSECGKSSLLLKTDVFSSRYVGVATSESLRATKQHQFLLAHFLGTVIENITEEKDCRNLAEKNDEYNFLFLNGQLNITDNMTRIHECIKSAANVSEALSPAFKINDYEWSSNQYSAWTESRWDIGAMQMRIFLMPNHDREIIALSIGIIMFVLSSVLVFLIQKKSVTLFTGADT